MFPFYQCYQYRSDKFITFLKEDLKSGLPLLIARLSMDSDIKLNFNSAILNLLDLQFFKFFYFVWFQFS